MYGDLWGPPVQRVLQWPVLDAMDLCVPGSYRDVKIGPDSKVQLRRKFSQIRIEGKHQMHIRHLGKKI